MSCRCFALVLLAVSLSFVPMQVRAQRVIDREPFRGDCLGPRDFVDRDVPLQDLNLDTSVRGNKIPIDCSINLYSGALGGDRLHRRAQELEFHWAANELFHQSLYFDDTLLERYGQTRHPVIQPVLSGARFFGTFPLVPYKMGLDRTHDHVYTLGQYRPGSVNPCLQERLIFEKDAAFFEVATAMAIIFLLP
jgi:hypothetical protein